MKRDGVAFIANQKHRVWKFEDRIEALLRELGMSKSVEALEEGVELMTITFSS